MGKLDITGWGFLLGVGLVTAVGWLWVVLRWRRHHRVRTSTVAVVLTLLLAADGVNSYFSDLPHLADVVSAATGTTSWKQLPSADLEPVNYAKAVRGAPDGGIVRLHVPDRGSGFGPSTALVYVPPQYFAEPDRRFPVVYLLHGSPGTPADWIRGGGAASTGAHLAAIGRPVLIVMPKMSHHWLDDPECVDGVHLRDETHLLADVLPAADGTFRTVPDARSRTIAGMSAGGFCALNVGLRHPGLFGTIVDLSGLDRPTHSGGTSALFGPGPAGAAAEAANDPSQYVARLPEDLATRVWLDVGRQDGAVRPGMERMESALRARHVDVRLTVRPGAHTYHVWRPALLQALQWTLAPAVGPQS